MTSLRSSIRTAVEVPRWAIGFYRAHLLLVVAISLVPAAHRFVLVLWGWNLPFPVNVVVAILTPAARLLLIGVIIWLALVRDDTLSQLSSEDRQRRMTAFISTRWPSLIVQVCLIVGSLIIFNYIPEQILSRWIPDTIEPIYFATLLAVKNLTVIAIMMIWMVGIGRQMMLYSPSQSSDDGSVSRSLKHH